ncbi:MAG TPA: hypothetical protein VK186_01145 [Candidatus Deferrimicrobium sp.]|nr:hypothetical protein [Candidatus Deferrimicrobium sp.]
MKTGKEKASGKKSVKKKRPSKYDAAWKNFIKKHFKDFLEFFFPDIHNDIDFARKPEFLDKELSTIEPDSKMGDRSADLLAKVFLKSGDPKFICLLIHVEVQGQKDPHLMRRMFIYYYRIFDRLWEEGTGIISLAILTDADEDYLPAEFNFSGWGFEHRLKIPMVKLIDYKNKEELQEKLVKSTNPMAIVVKVQLKSLEVKRLDDAARYNIKRELIRELYRHGYDRDEIRQLFYFIGLVVRLPVELEKKLLQEVIKIEEEYNMQYITIWEREAKKEGKKLGEKLGEKRGEKRGEERGDKNARIETARELVKYGVDIDIISKSTGLQREEIEKLVETVQ